MFLSLMSFFSQALRMGIPFGISILIFSPYNAYAKTKPSWYPKVSCDQAWQGQNPYQYSFEKYAQRKSGQQANFGYQNFLKDVEEELLIKRQDCFKEWTILVYMAANNDLSPYSLWDLLEMEADYPVERKLGLLRAGSTLESDLLVDLQNEKSQDLKRLHIFQSKKAFNRDLKLDEVKKLDLGSIHSPVALWQDERLSTPEEQIYDFIQWGIKEYPAENYMVVVWGHGQGWGADGENISLLSPFEGRFGGLAFQNEDEEFLTTPALSRILQKSQEEVFENKKSIDIYASDACLMQMLEVSYELSDFTDYIVGSAQVQSYLGFPYRRMMYEINRGCYNERGEDDLYCGDNIGIAQTRPNAHPLPRLQRVCGNDKACYLAQMLPKLTHQSFHNTLGLQGKATPEAYNNMTLSSLNAKTLSQDLVSQMDSFSLAMLQFIGTLETYELIDLQKVITESPHFLGDGREVGILLGQIEIFLLNFQNSLAARQLFEEIVRFKAFLNTTVLSHAYGKNYVEEDFHLLGAKSVALWVPSTDTVFESRIEDFQKSYLYHLLKKDDETGKTLWQIWIKELLNPPKANPFQ